MGQVGREVVGLRLQQILESLELVQHHEIRLKRGNADPRHNAADLADQLLAPRLQLVRELAFPLQLVDKVLEQFANGRLAAGRPGLVDLC